MNIGRLSQEPTAWIDVPRIGPLKRTDSPRNEPLARNRDLKYIE